MSDSRLIVDLTKAYNLQMQKLAKAVKDRNAEEASYASDGVYENRMMIYDKLREETYIHLPDASIIQTLLSIRDNKDDQLLGFVKWTEEKDSEHTEAFKKEHPDIWEKFGLWSSWLLDDTKDNPLNDEEERVLWEHINARPSRHVPAVDDLDKNEYARNKATDNIVELYEKLDLYSYWVRSLEVGPILLVEKETMPSVGFFEEIRSSYSLGQYASSIVLCRALLEELLKNFYKQKMNVTSEKELEDLWKRDLYGLIGDEKLYLNGTLKDRLHRVRLCAKEVVHRGMSVDQNEALEHIKNTLAVIEELYS
jgi:hypothetical protein